MIEYELAGTDLGEVRFAVSPLTELVLSLRSFRDPGRFPLHLPWLRATEDARAGLDVELLTALSNEAHWVPDFLNPRPHSPLARLDDELAELASTAPARVRAGIAEVHPDPATRPAVLTGRPDHLLGRIVRALTAYWDACFDPYWPRMRALLEADVVHRGRMIARSGLAAMFADLSPSLRLEGDVVQVRMRHRVRFRRSVAGEGLTLLPTLFNRHVSAPISAAEPPVLMYAARGLGTLWEADRVDADGSLVDLIGAARSRLLLLLGDPASSTELAGRLGVTVPAVNQHLRVMRAGGLLTSARHGRYVLYLRSELGDRLVGADRPVTEGGTGTPASRSGAGTGSP